MIIVVEDVSESLDGEGGSCNDFGVLVAFVRHFVATNNFPHCTTLAYFILFMRRSIHLAHIGLSFSPPRNQ